MSQLDTYHTKAIRQVQIDTDQLHRVHIDKVIEQVLALLLSKGEDYDNLNIFVEKMPFGTKSWATLLWIKAKRLASVIHRGESTYDGIAEIVLDIIVYAVAFLAWIRIREEETEE